MKNLRLPATPSRLTIASDGDTAGRKAAHALAERANNLGWAVSFLEAPEGQDWNDVLQEGGAEVMELKPFVPKPKRVFTLTRVGELHYKEPEYLIDGLVETECLSMIFGDPGCGKSFFSLDVALSVATGADFHGRKVSSGRSSISRARVTMA